MVVRHVGGDAGPLGCADAPASLYFPGAYAAHIGDCFQRGRPTIGYGFLGPLDYLVERRAGTGRTDADRPLRYRCWLPIHPRWANVGVLVSRQHPPNVGRGSSAPVDHL